MTTLDNCGADAAFYSIPENSLGFLTRIAFRSFSRELEARTLAYGVSAGQWRFLRVLWFGDGISQKDLSRKAGMRDPTTVTALNGMERAGLVIRKKADTDRRSNLIFLTAKGKALEKKLMPCVADVNTLATRNMTPEEIVQLRTLLGKAIRELSPREIIRDSR